MSIRLLLLALTIASSITGVARAADVDSPVGRWQTFDDRTSRPRGIVRIYEKDGKVFGRVELTAERAHENPTCTACTDERRGQPLDGLVIIRDMAKSADTPLEWSGGDILDPDDGKVYRFRMRLEDHGATLQARGFIGISLIGRTQTWKRLPWTIRVAPPCDDRRASSFSQEPP